MHFVYNIQKVDRRHLVLYKTSKIRLENCLFS